VQLIGVAACTNRRFGYCGNDFGAAAELVGESGIGELEEIARRTGMWLYEQGYVGAFGVDALLYGCRICLTEINPRFQGSSASAAFVASRAGLPDIYLDHLCAVMGLAAPERHSLWEQAVEQAKPDRRLSQVVCYNTAEPKRMRTHAVVPDLPYGDIKATPDPEIVVHREAMLFKIFAHESVTSSGFDVAPSVAADVATVTRRIYEPIREC